MYDNTKYFETPSRIRSLDFIRGIAVLGILMMNIQSFSMPFSAYSNPLNYGDFSGENYWVWYFSHLLFDQKFMSIFSILFGAGVYIFAKKVDQKEGHSGKRHYLRMLWLLVFGLIHAYLVWYGDILVAYAISGMFVYLFREAQNKTLVLTALALIGITSLLVLMQGFALLHLSDENVLNEIVAMWTPAQDTLLAEVNAYRSGLADIFEQRLRQALEMQSYMPFYLPKVLGLNLVGIWLFRSGFFQRQWSNFRYIAMGVILTVLGLTLTYLGAEKNIEQNFNWQYSMAFGYQFNYWGSVFSALGYMSLLMLLCSNIDHHRIKKALARVGQMAFTNYILQSLICTFVFYGYGFGMFGQLERIHQFYVVMGVWVLLILFSSFWMSRFSMGPLEWVWRRLTYGRAL
jgi:uncharacterized protein